MQAKGFKINSWAKLEHLDYDLFSCGELPNLITVELTDGLVGVNCSFFANKKGLHMNACASAILSQYAKKNEVFEIYGPAWFTYDNVDIPFDKAQFDTIKSFCEN